MIALFQSRYEQNHEHVDADMFHVYMTKPEEMNGQSVALHLLAIV